MALLDGSQGLLPKEYGWVLLDVVLLAILQHVYMPYHIRQARKKYRVSPPAIYAAEGHKDGEQFNRIQRGHQNTLEMAPVALTSLVLSGLRFPVLAAVCGGVYVLARLLYFQGYRKVWLSSRTPGFLLALACVMVLLGSLVKFAYELLWAA